jgi:hypothetical protein
MSTIPTNTDDIIDSRDVIEAIASLTADDPTNASLPALIALAAQAADYAADWEYGEQLIRHTYFVEYAQELADDCGLIPRDVSWPLTCIDWQHAARELEYDYTHVEFDGVTYLIR